MTATQNTFQSIARIQITKLRKTTATTTNRGRGKDRKAPRPWPAKKLAEAAIEFTDGFMAGHTLYGFTIWRRQDGDDIFVTPPQKSYEKDNETHYVSFLACRTEHLRDQFQSLILDEYRRVIAQRATSKEAAEDAGTAESADATEPPDDEQPF